MPNDDEKQRHYLLRLHSQIERAIGDFYRLNEDEYDRAVDALSRLQNAPVDRAERVEHWRPLNQLAALIQSSTVIGAMDGETFGISDSAVGESVKVGRLLQKVDLVGLTAEVRHVVDSFTMLGLEEGRMSVSALATTVNHWLTDLVPRRISDVQGQLAQHGLQLEVSDSLSKRLTEYHLREVSKLRVEAAETVQNLKMAAGEGGKERLAQTFETRGNEEAVSASNWNLLVMLFVALSMLIPLVLISLGDHFLGQLSDTYALVVKALTSVPMAFMATYAGRISAQHRKLSQHMKTLTAQIDSVAAYVAPLSEDRKQDLIATLGKRAFSEPGVTTPGEGTVGLPPEDIRPILEKAIEAMKPDKSDKK